MIALDTTTRSLQVVLAGAKNTNDCPWTASYEDVAVAVQPQGNVAVAGLQQGTTNGATAVTILPANPQAAAPAGSPPATGTLYFRRLKSFNLSNADLAAITVTVQFNDTTGSVTRKVFGPLTLQVNESLFYEDGSGWAALDANGNTKTTSGSAASSTADSKAVSAAAVGSTADSKAVSDSANTSTALSTATSIGSSGSAATSTALSTATSNNTAASVADSKAVSDSVVMSTNLSVNTSKDTSQSVIMSSLGSRLTSAGK